MDDRTRAAILKATERNAKKVAKESARALAAQFDTGPKDGRAWSNVCPRRARIAKRLGYDVHDSDPSDVGAEPYWIPKALNDAFILVERALVFNVYGVSRLAEAAESASPRVEAVLRELDSREGVAAAVEGSLRLGGLAAAFELIREIDRSLT